MIASLDDTEGTIVLAHLYCANDCVVVLYEYASLHSWKMTTKETITQICYVMPSFRKTVPFTPERSAASSGMRMPFRRNLQACRTFGNTLHAEAWKLAWYCRDWVARSWPPVHFKSQNHGSSCASELAQTVDCCKICRAERCGLAIYHWWCQNLAEASIPHHKELGFTEY